MSSIASMALPGRIPSVGGGVNAAMPESLFSSEAERAAYQKIIDGAMGVSSDPFKKVKNVKVRIFDLSDKKQVEEYENLSKELWGKIQNMEALVESRKDLVHRSDGTSYWMKYVEYIEFSNGKNEDKDGGKDD